MESNTTITRILKGFAGRKGAQISALALVMGVLFILSWSFAPASIGVNEARAANEEVRDPATAEMLAYALNFKSASNLAVFGGNSVTDQGSSQFRGVVGGTGIIHGVTGKVDRQMPQSNTPTNRDTTEVSGANQEIGRTRQDVLVDPEADGNFMQARRDLTDVLNYVDQLPCTRLDDPNLGGRTFGPGVYCLASANLAGRMTVDAGGDVNARFVFRVDGTFGANDSSSIVSEGGAVATNVYLFARGGAVIGGDAAIGASVISRQDVSVGHGSTVSGKVVSVDGNVTTNANIVAAGTGYIEICKLLATGETVIAPGTIFTFTLTGAINPSNSKILVPAGSCSAPIQVASGNQTVTEIDPTANISVIGIAATPTNRLVNSSLGLRQAVVSAPDGDVTNETVVTFTNQTTRTGTVEICKFGNDSDVTGFFNFTVQGAPGQMFSVPVGFCSGPITVTNPAPGPTPGPFNTNVTELAQATFRLESVETFPATASNGVTLDQGFDSSGNPLANNTNGGYANVKLNIAGGAANQTTVRFFNRSLPGRIKICKITVDPNIPVGTAFTYQVAGLQGMAPGMPALVSVDVLAGPAAQGGFCAFVPGTWLVGSPVAISEVGISSANTISLPLGLTATVAGLRTSRIQSSTTFVTRPVTLSGVFSVGAGPDPDIFNSFGIINAHNSTVEIEFTNFVYRPAILKLCKVAGPGVANGTTFTFTIAPADPLTTWPYPTGTITVRAGSCTFVNGPFPSDPAFPGVGLFNFGTSIIVTENLSLGTNVTAITSPTLTGTTPVGTLIQDLINRRGTMTLNQLLPNFNEIVFTNGSSGSPTAANLSLGGRVLTADGRGIRSAIIKVDGNTLPETLTTITSPFGYYQINGLAAGETYVVTVNSKQYRFAVPNRIVSMIDNLSEVNFTAIP